MARLWSFSANIGPGQTPSTVRSWRKSRLQVCALLLQRRRVFGIDGIRANARQVRIDTQIET
jgi:hypothetical protein